MAADHLDQSFNDSLENAAKGELMPAAKVAPEGRNAKTDYTAFSKLEREDGSDLYLGLLPHSAVPLLQDKASGKNRALGVSKLQASAEATEGTMVLESNLAALVDVSCAAVSDSHIKVSVAGLQLLLCLVSRIGGSLFSYHSQIVQAVLSKMGTNKFVLKQNGMHVLVALMHASKPGLILMEVASFGLKHKQSKVREESLNVITASLLLFPKSKLQLIMLAKEVLPALYDSKPKVRQAAMECATAVASLCDEANFKRVVSLLPKNNGMNHTKEGTTTSAANMGILEALNSRLLRGLPPKVGESSLVEYGMPVVGVDVPLSELGPDVEWIREGQLLKNASITEVGKLAMSRSLTSSAAQREGKFRPFRSASKRLPWELEEEESKVQGNVCACVRACACVCVCVCVCTCVCVCVNVILSLSPLRVTKT